MIPSFIVVFREILEAALIVGIVLSYLKRIDARNHFKQVWLGAAAGAGASIVGAVLFQLIDGGFSGRAGTLFEGFSFLIAAALLSTFIFWLIIEEKYADRIRNKIDVTPSRRKAWGIFFLVFISVLREGIETVIFLRSLITYQEGIFLPIMGALTGFIFALLAGILIYFSGRRMPLKLFFLVTNIILIFFAAGMVAYGVHELEEAGLLPSIIEHVYDINPPVAQEGVYPLLHENGALGGILKGLLGYNGNPSLLELIAYVFYLAVAITVWFINRIYQKRKKIVK